MDFLLKILENSHMKIINSIIAFITALVQMLSGANFGMVQTPKGQQLDLTGYKLVLEDNFNENALDLSKWEYRCTGARSGGFFSPNQVSLSDGNLIIRGEYRQDGEFGAGWYAGMIRSVQEFTRGYFEIRCKASEGGGFWSAFWLNSSGMSNAETSKGGIGGAEIDIFEALNYPIPLIKNSVSLNMYVNGYGKDMKSNHLGNYKANNPYTEYNTYGLEWNEKEYIFYINGVEATRTSFKDGVSEAPEFAILSLETPSVFTEEPGFSTDYIVDYVKIYQKA